MRFIKKTFPENLKPFGIGHEVLNPVDWRGGVIFASPHSGAIYPQSLLARAKVSAHQLRRNEDIFIDHLFHSAIDAGAPFIRALFPRVIVDAIGKRANYRRIGMKLMKKTSRNPPRPEPQRAWASCRHIFPKISPFITDCLQLRTSGKD